MTQMVFVSKGRVKLICPQCGKEFETYLSVAKRPGTHCCSWPCEVKLHPRIKKHVLVPKSCENCGKIFEVMPRRKDAARFCCYPCAAEFQRGPGHRNYKDGSSKLRGQSRKAVNARVKAEGKCQRCGETNNLHGHHIKSYARHPELRDDPQNIEVLCQRCHALEHPRQANLILKRSAIKKARS
jgi:5-methylcytosine-specific restriction endonuclease McrA